MGRAVYIEKSELPRFVKNALRRNGIETLEDLKMCDGFKSLDHVGEKGEQHIREWLMRVS